MNLIEIWMAQLRDMGSNLLLIKFHPIIMMDQRVLESQEADATTFSHSLKLSYLYKEKEQMEVEIKELRLNNQLLRSVNAALASPSACPQLQQLVDRNQALELCVERLMSEKSKQADEIFLMNQIRDETEKELHQVASNYEQKIIELRRSIQFKEGTLQKLESHANLCLQSEEVILPPYNVSMHFHAQFQEYKDLNQELSDSNKQLKEQLARLTAETDALKKRLKKIELLSRSRCSFLQFRSLISQNTHSLPHGARIQLGSAAVRQEPNISKFSKTNINEYTTGNTFRDHSVNRNNQARRILKAKQIENKELKTTVRQLNLKIKEMTKSMKTLLNSNQYYQKTRKLLNLKLNSCQKENEDLKLLLLRRRDYVRSISANSHLRAELVPRKVAKQKQPLREHQQCLEYLKKSAKEMKKWDGIALKRVRGRSYSCVMDFVTRDSYEAPSPEENEFSNIFQEEGNELEGGIGFKEEFSMIESRKVGRSNKNKQKIEQLGRFLDEVF